MSKSAKQSLILLAVVAFGFAAIYALSNRLERTRPPLPEGFADEDLALRAGKIKDFSLGMNGLLADFYWMQALQYIGDKAVNSKEKLDLENLRALDPKLLYPLLDNAADLDPQFDAVYSYGAVVLPAIDKAQAIALCEKGIANNPDNWRLYQHLGFIYWKLGDYEKAAATYEKGGQISGAPEWMRLMSARMKTEGGSRATSRSIYEEMLAGAQDEQVRQNARLRIAEFDSLDEQDAIRAALANFKSKTGRCAAAWREIFPLLQTAKLPNGKSFSIDKANNVVDPTGAPYVLNARTCDVELDRAATKLPF